MTTLQKPNPHKSDQPRARCRDRELVRYVGRFGVVSIEHVMATLAVGQASAYRRVAACIERGLLERLDLLRREPSLLRATRAGLRYAGLGLPVAIVSPGAVDHWLRCATTAQMLAEEFGGAHVLTERELRLLERLEGRPIASAKLGELPSGHPRLHRPDLVVLPAGHPLVRFHEEGTGPSSTAPDGNQARGTGEDDEAFDFSPSHSLRHASSRGTTSPSSSRTQGGGRCERTDVRERDPRTEDAEMRSATSFIRPIAVEVELTPKAPQRLLQIIRAWRGADWVAEVRYHCAPGATRRGVEKAVAKTYAADRVRLFEAVPRARSEQASNSASSRREQSGSRCSK